MPPAEVPQGVPVLLHVLVVLADGAKYQNQEVREQEWPVRWNQEHLKKGTEDGCHKCQHHPLPKVELSYASKCRLVIATDCVGKF